MPKHLLIACLFYIAARSGMAILAPLYETGFARVTSPLLMLLFIAGSVQFMRRIPWAWQTMQTIAFSEIMINALFFPTPEFHGGYTDLARLFTMTIMAACCVILWSLSRRSDAKAWFRNHDA